MNSLLKRKLSEFYTRLSAFFMVGMILLDATFMVPVHAAFVGPVVVDSTVAVASALAALGIGFSGNMSTPDWLAFIKNIGDAVQDKLGGVTAVQTGNAIDYHLTHDFIQSVGMKFGDYISSAEQGTSLASAFPSSAKLSQQNLSTPMTIEQFYNAIGCPYQSDKQYSGITANITGYTVLQKAFYARSSFYFADNISMKIAGNTYCLSNSSGGDSGKSQLWIKTNGNWNCINQGSYMAMQLGSGNILLDGYLVAFMFQGSISPHYYLVNTEGASSDTNLGYFPTYQYLLSDDSQGAALPANDAQASHFFPLIYAQGASVLTQPQADVQSKLDAKTGEKDSTGTTTGDVVHVPADANTQNPSKLRDATSTQTKVAGQEVATETDKTADDTYNQTNTKDTTPPKAADMPDLKLPTGLQRKFPFCLPWDFMALVNLFNVPAVAPVWTVPVNIDVGLVHVHQSYTYDLNSNHVLDTGLFVFKWFLNLSYTLGLVFLTRKIVM